MGKDENKAPHPPHDLKYPVRIRFHSIAKRLPDADGFEAKALQDALVIGGVLPDDSPKYVSEVRHTQEKGSPERTIITIEGA